MKSFKGNLFIITAASGAGKTSLVKALVSDNPNIKVSISFTTRKPRVGEKNGEDYFFLDEINFKKMVENNDFLEMAKCHGAFYGTSKSTVEEAIKKGEDIILEIDYQGAFSVKKLFPESISIFIIPPSIKDLEDRLHNRGQDSKEDIKLRVATARNEMSHLEKFDYVTINDNFEKALSDLKSIVDFKPEAFNLKMKNQIFNHKYLIDELKK
ncbi:guanylate kinase [Methylophilaceae bacterium]|jgi:guanylate kinase|nr:guanylate kinase [Methylophilaceae bacterium]|tara:strand:+ start:2424 stop:3056 length:633 start_codon:yes stop_codon:yes gene_type:complete